MTARINKKEFTDPVIGKKIKVWVGECDLEKEFGKIDTNGGWKIKNFT